MNVLMEKKEVMEILTCIGSRDVSRPRNTFLLRAPPPPQTLCSVTRNAKLATNGGRQESTQQNDQMPRLCNRILLPHN